MRGAARLTLILLLARAGGAKAEFWRAAAEDHASRPAAERWTRLGDERAAQGRHAAAAADYLAAIAAGAAQPGLSTRLGDVLMAEGELASAQAAYRDALAAAALSPAASDREVARLEDPHGRAQETALAALGLAAALDRAGQGSAARQTLREALAADATAAVLEAATLPGSDVRILPDGEVFYRLGLVRQATGRRTDAEAAFHEYLERVPKSRWAEAAQAHIAELESPAGRRAAGASRGPRVLTAATVLSTGGTPAPVIDAAWRNQVGILDDCLEEAGGIMRGGAPLRIAIELEIDGRGRVTAAVAKLAVANADSFARCLETAVRGLRLPAATGGRSTRARTELLLGFPGPP